MSTQIPVNAPAPVMAEARPQVAEVRPLSQRVAEALERPYQPHAAPKKAKHEPVASDVSGLWMPVPQVLAKWLPVTLEPGVSGPANVVAPPGTLATTALIPDAGIEQSSALLLHDAAAAGEAPSVPAAGNRVPVMLPPTPAMPAPSAPVATQLGDTSSSVPAVPAVGPVLAGPSESRSVVAQAPHDALQVLPVAEDVRPAEAPVSPAVHRDLRSIADAGAGAGSSIGPQLPSAAPPATPATPPTAAPAPHPGATQFAAGQTVAPVTPPVHEVAPTGTTVRFESWGQGHEVNVAFAAQSVVLTPSSDRVGQALQHALQRLDSDLHLPTLRVAATDADGRQSQGRGRQENAEDT